MLIAVHLADVGGWISNGAEIKWGHKYTLKSFTFICVHVPSIDGMCTQMITEASRDYCIKVIE